MIFIDGKGMTVDEDDDEGMAVDKDEDEGTVWWR